MKWTEEGQPPSFLEDIRRQHERERDKSLEEQLASSLLPVGQQVLISVIQAVRADERARSCTAVEAIRQELLVWTGLHRGKSINEEIMPRFHAIIDEMEQLAVIQRINNSRNN